MNEMKIPPAAQQVLLQLQTFQQQLQTILLQKESLEIQKIEIERALEELEKVKEKEEVFKAVGPILVKSAKKDLVNELSEKKDTIELRLKTLSKQEKMLNEKSEELQKKLQNILTSSAGSLYPKGEDKKR